MNARDSQIRLQIVTPEDCVFDGAASMVELPTLAGQIGIYPGHVPLVASVGTGEIRVHSPEGEKSFAVLGGHVEIDPGRITVLALFASPETDQIKIEEACLRAKAALEMAENAPPTQKEDDLARLRIELTRGKNKTLTKRQHPG